MKVKVFDEENEKDFGHGFGSGDGHGDERDGAGGSDGNWGSQ